MSKEVIKKQLKKRFKEIPFQEDIEKISLFGSYIQKQEKDNSDIDLIIEFNPNSKIGFFELSKIQRYLEEILKKPVDLVTPNSLSKFFKQEVLNMAEKVYER